MKKFKRPRCDNCGAKIYPKAKPFRENNWLFGEIPSYCPDCGKELSNQKRAQLDEYKTLIYYIWCLVCIFFVIITIVIIIAF